MLGRIFTYPGHCACQRCCHWRAASCRLPRCCATEWQPQWWWPGVEWLCILERPCCSLYYSWTVCASDGKSLMLCVRSVEVFCDFWWQQQALLYHTHSAQNREQPLSCALLNYLGCNWKWNCLRELAEWRDKNLICTFTYSKKKKIQIKMTSGYCGS